MVYPVISSCEDFITTTNETLFFETSPFKVKDLSKKDQENYKNFVTQTLITPTLLQGKMETPNTVNEIYFYILKLCFLQLKIDDIQVTDTSEEQRNFKDDIKV
jgi:hypothetical protein